MGFSRQVLESGGKADRRLSGHGRCTVYQGIQFAIANVMPAVINTGLLVERFTAQKPDDGQTSTGAPDGGYIDVPGLIGIACNSAVQSMVGIDPTEIRQLEDILARAPRHVMLDADYTALLAGWRSGWRAVVTYPDGTVTHYIIMGVETDSVVTHTRVELSEVSV